ncbi:unnamed protein product [Litomosoides sigmodontis]|uniref:Zasp-like motif domain-containing protein n=1 Tax=Litomosoides sigmodontis TaxID=42156 RepID=A0A3P6TLL6_LITSI|nr:unnamed protein product [Litomosoides sigmodontis]
MLFRLLMAAQLVQFCATSHIPDLYWSPSIFGHRDGAEEVNNKVTAAHGSMTLTKDVQAAASASAEASTVVAEQLSSVRSFHLLSQLMKRSAVHLQLIMMRKIQTTKLAGFQVPSVETIPMKQYQYNNKNYMLASEQELETFAGGKQNGNEVFRRRVSKMAVPPGYQPKTASASTSAPGYKPQVQYPAGSPAPAYKPSESVQYGLRKI